MTDQRPGSADPTEADTQTDPPAPGMPASADPRGWVVPPPRDAPSSVAPSPTGAEWVRPVASPGGSIAPLVVGAIIVVAVVAIATVAGLMFLGSQVAGELKGTVEFGTGGSGCIATGSASSFSVGRDLHVVAHLERSVAAGETVTLLVSVDGTQLGTRPETMTDSADCLFEDLDTTDLDAGRYHLEFRAADEVLAMGDLTLTS